MYTVGILIFPDVEELDFVGPFEILSYINKLVPNSLKVSVISATKEPVRCFNGLRVLPDSSFTDCPPLDIIVIPGGQGRRHAMKDAAILDFVKKQAQSAKYTTSVCTGAFILAEAELLTGKKATTYHSVLAELADYNGITVEKRKVVHDGNLITAAGVSSGIELGLYVIKLLFGDDLARQTAAKIEYEPDWTALNM